MSKIILSIIKGAHKPLPDCYSQGLREVAGQLLRVAPEERPSVAEVLQMDYVK